MYICKIANRLGVCRICSTYEHACRSIFRVLFICCTKWVRMRLCEIDRTGCTTCEQKTPACCPTPPLARQRKTLFAWNTSGCNLIVRLRGLCGVVHGVHVINQWATRLRYCYTHNVIAQRPRQIAHRQITWTRATSFVCFCINVLYCCDCDVNDCQLVQVQYRH